MSTVKLGIVGCGVISDAYLKGGARSRLIAVKSVTDLVPEAAAAKAKEYGCQAVSYEEMLADPEIAIIVNLTVPMAHAEISGRAIAAGKHVYSEKPFAVTFADAKALVAQAATAGVRIGSAPDTFLGAGHQAVRRAIDDGLIGEIVGGAACFATHGMEAWHPNPTFFFKRGGGPVLDIGPYPVTQLVHLLGPVAYVTSVASKAFATRTIGNGPRLGEVIEVEVPTSIEAVLTFANGANVSLTLSWDIWKHNRLPIELYGTKGSITNPDPNFFGGSPKFTAENGDWQDLPITAHPFGIANRKTRAGLDVADYRIIGALDMAQAVAEGRPHRASGEMALHVLEILEALDTASKEGKRLKLTTTCERPDPVPLGEDESVFVAKR